MLLRVCSVISSIVALTWAAAALKASRSRILMDFRYKRKFQAENGHNGMKRKKYGKQGKDLIIKIPTDTLQDLG